MDPTPKAPAREPLGLRLLRSAITIGLTLALIVITALALIGFLPAVRAAFEPLFSYNTETPSVAIGLSCLVALLLPSILLAVAARKGWLTWPVLGIGAVLTGTVLVWLAADEPAIRQPLPIDEFSPAFAGAEQSSAVLMQYSRQAPSDEAKAFEKIKLAAVWNADATTREPARWLGFVAKNRAALESDWAAIAPQRRWLGELSAFDRLGDLTPAKPDANFISFQVWRTLAQRTCAQATLQALDGHGDDAISTLLPMLEAGRRLQPSSRTLVRTMIGIVIERMCVETAGIVLDQAPASAATRARLAAALSGENAPALARRLILVEYAQFAPSISSMKLGDLVTYNGERLPILRRPLNLFSRILINPNATINLYGSYLYELAALAETRELGKFAVRSKDFGNQLQHLSGMKNLGGRLLLNMAVPAYQKVVESFWQTNDVRETLRKRLATPVVAGK